MHAIWSNFPHFPSAALTTPILQLGKSFATCPVPQSLVGVRIRALKIPAETSDWLALRDRAFRAASPAIRPWEASDFDREVASRGAPIGPHTWVAVAEEPTRLVGAASLIRRRQLLAIHWLMVDPDWRRQGIGRALVAQLERLAYRAGAPELVLETHVGWEAAVSFYRSAGYAGR